MGSRSAAALVFTTSGLVLVLEIVAGRLMAPYVGVSLESFTGIIGTVLAGIAVGSAVGGTLADRRDPLRLIGQALFFGGALSWLSIPIVVTMGPSLGSSPLEIVVLSGSAFFLPAAVLSGIAPMVAKLRLGSLERTGSVIGRLSAWGTFGALAGTFGSGFILIALLPVRVIILSIGAVLVAGGFVVLWKSRRGRPDLVETGLVVVAAVIAIGIGSPCDHETDYYCVRIVADDDRPGGRSLVLDQVRHAHVDLVDPTHLEIRYVRLLADVADALAPGPLTVLHLGGGGFSFPRYLTAVRPGSTHTVLELDDGLVEIARSELGLSDTDGIDIRTGDARLHLDELPTGTYDLIVGDTFGGDSVPWHLTTTEVMEELQRLMRPNGVYAMNVIDGGESGFSRAELATLGATFTNTGLIEPMDGIPDRRVNQILLASDADLPELRLAESDGRLVDPDALIRFVGDAQILTDDFAPADQLLG